LDVDRPAEIGYDFGAVVFQDGNLAAVVGFTIAHSKIVEMNILADPDRLARLGIGSDA
jgi:RNA polymerase sigma-70 factor (ECF subfamily)